MAPRKRTGGRKSSASKSKKAGSSAVKVASTKAETPAKSTAAAAEKTAANAEIKPTAAKEEAKEAAKTKKTDLAVVKGSTAVDETSKKSRQQSLLQGRKLNLPQRSPQQNVARQRKLMQAVRKLISLRSTERR